MLVFGEQPGDWTNADRRLVLAYQTLQDETCGHCGNPLWLCRNTDVEWVVETDTCFAERATADWQEKRSDKKNYNGIHPYAVPYTIAFDESGYAVEDRENLPSRRAFFDNLD